MPGASLDSGPTPVDGIPGWDWNPSADVTRCASAPASETAFGRVILGSRGFWAQGDSGRTKGLELKVTLNEAMSERLRDIAKARGLDPNEVLERAVALYGYALDKAEPNGPFLQVKENGQDKKVAL